MSLIEILSFPARRASKIALSDLFALRRQRLSLKALSAEQLDDIGITREDAEHEAARPLWDAPDHWYRR